MKKNGPKTSPVQCNRWLLILTFMLMSFHAGAQNKVTVSGVVSDEKGTPMVGVTVLVKNTNIGRITGMKGEYRLEIPANSVLVFSYMGYTTEERLVSTQTQINVTLTEQAQAINDVVVTALGIKREQKALGYATTKLGGDKISEALSTNWTSALSGKIAGLNLVRSGAGPAGSNKIILRGESNLTGDNQALIVIDGVVINSSSGLSTGSGNSSYLGEDSPVGFNRPAPLRSSGAGCFPLMYVEKLYGTKRYARCIGAGRKDAGQSGRWGSSSACFYFTRPLIFVLRRRALRDVLLCLLFMGNNALVKQVFNRHSKRMGNSFQCFQAHFPDSAAPGAGV